MFCSNCGNQLEENADFCWHCGQPSSPGKKSKDSGRSQVEFEVCEIVWEVTRKPKLLELNSRAKFFVRAIGPSGKYTVAESREFVLGGDEGIRLDPETKASHDDLVQNLVQDGWQPIEGTSTVGFHIQFKRPVSVRRLHGHIRNVRDGEFQTEVIVPSESEIVLVYFWASWASPCESVNQYLARIAEDFAGRLRVAKINVDESPTTPKRLKIEGVPALVFFKCGRECERVIGAVREQDVLTILKRHL